MLNKPISTATQAALDEKAAISQLPELVWTGNITLTIGQNLSRDTYFGGAFGTGVTFMMTFWCSGNEAFGDTCVTVPYAYQVGFVTMLEFTVPSNRGAPERMRISFSQEGTQVKVIRIDAAQISSTGGTNWGDASGRAHLLQVMRIDPT